MIDRPFTDLTELVAAIARSAITVAAPFVVRGARRALPPGYDEIDLAVLEWIAAEGRRSASAFPPL